MSNIKSLSPNAQEFIPTLHTNHVVVGYLPSMTRTKTHDSSRQYPQQQNQQVRDSFLLNLVIALILGMQGPCAEESNRNFHSNLSQV